MGFRSNILVVNNEPSISQLLLMLLGGRGFRTEALSSGRQVLLKSHTDTDLIILDSDLPDIKGLKVCQLLKQDPQTQHIPIIVLGNKENSEKIESLQLGAEDYLSKPFATEELFARLEGALRRCGGYKEDLENRYKHQYEVIQELKDIIHNEQIIPYFQPIYSLNPMCLLGLEVLARPMVKGRLSNPEMLFSEALQYGLYFDLEMLVWKKAIEIAKRFLGEEYLFLNCDPYLVESNRFESVKGMFEEFAMAPKHVFFEITERCAIVEGKAFLNQLKDYRQHGFKIAIDDVGAGYASLDMIIQTKPEVVKIDRKIITGAVEDSFKRSIVKLIVAFCHENDIICIAEGIETKEDLDFMNQMKVFAGQGYYLYKPTEIINLDAMRSIKV